MKLENVSKIYKVAEGETKALDNVSVAFSSKGLVVIAGENGSGKSTLLNIIGKMDNKSDGVVTLAHFNYDNLTKKDEDEIRFNYISYIFQASNLVNYLTVYENLEIICQNNSEKIKTALKTVDMEDYELRFPNELSQGQQQRVCLARAMLSPTPILLADEPTSSLDPAGAKEVARLLKEVSKDKLVLVVTHDLELFADYDRRIVLERGKIIEDNIINKCETLTEVDNITRKATLPIKPIINASKRKIRKNIGSFIVNVFMVLIFILGITVVANIPFKFNYKIYTNAIEKQGYNYVNVSGDINSISNVDVIKSENFVFDRYLAMSDFYGDSEIKEKNAYYGAFCFYFKSPQKIFSADLIANESITGKLPTAFNEVVISNYLADLIIYYGKAILDKNGDIIENADASIENTKFKNYEQILDEFYFTKYGEKYKVVGIINYELKEFESLKTQVIGDITNKTNYLNTSTVAAVGGLEASGEYLSLVKLINKYSTSLSNIYVSNNFCEEVYKTIKTMPVTINYSNKQIWQQLKNKENFTNNNCIGLPNNEGIIAPISLFLNEVEYAKKFSNTNYETTLNAFFDGIKGSLLTGYINIDEDINEPISQQVVAIYDDYKTEKRGVLFLDNDQFLQVAKKFARKNDNYGVIKVLGNEKAIETLFKEQAQADSRKFNIYFEESGFINMSTENYAIFAVIFCVFAIIAMILATVFIIYSINQNLKLYKRDYGIIKSLGFSNANLSKFYMCDSVIAFLVALITGIIFGVIIMFVINFYLIQKIVDVVIVGYMWATPFIIVTILMLVFLFTFFISGKKIRKDPPINSLIGR